MVYLVLGVLAALISTAVHSQYALMQIIRGDTKWMIRNCENK
jgi:hypothetical protein